VFVKNEPNDPAGASAPLHSHDAYFGLSDDERGFMESLREWIKTTFPGGAPFNIEVTNGVSRERLTLDPTTGEVFMVKKKPQGKGKRKVYIDIMPEDEAKYEAAKPDDPKGTPFADPCVWWVWNGVDWICVAYGN